MQDIPGISGGAIMPNGRVGLILDVGSLVKFANADGNIDPEDSQTALVQQVA
jgi:two-component system chemotaxis sensor kinase CheA